MPLTLYKCISLTDVRNGPELYGHIKPYDLCFDYIPLHLANGQRRSNRLVHRLICGAPPFVIGDEFVLGLVSEARKPMIGRYILDYSSPRTPFAGDSNFESSTRAWECVRSPEALKATQEVFQNRLPRRTESSECFSTEP